MDPTDPDTMLEEHRELHRHLEEVRDAARAIPTLTPGQRAALVERTLATFRSVVLPHARDEERSVYATVAHVLGDPRATEAMIGDHTAIEALVDDLASIDMGHTDRLQEVLYGLYALLSVHLWKEEHLYVPLLRVQESRRRDEVDYDAPVLLHEP